MKPGLRTSEAAGAGTALGVVLVVTMPEPRLGHVALAGMAVALAAWYAWLRTDLKRPVQPEGSQGAS